MAFRILGQGRPSSGIGTYEEIGIHAAGTAWVISTITLCNTDAALADTFIVAVKKGAGAPSSNNVIYRGTIPPEESFVITNGITLADGEHLYVATGAGRITATAFGDES